MPPSGEVMRLLSAAELSQVSGRAYFGQMSCIASGGSRRPMQEIGRALTSLPILTPLPLFPALSFLLLVPSCYFCDPTSTSCLSYATRGSQVWRGVRGKAYPFFKSPKTLSAKALRAI